MLKKISNKLILSYLTLTVILVVIIFVMLGRFLKATHIDILKTEMSSYDTMIDYEFRKLSVKPVQSAALNKTVSDLAAIIKLRITVIKPDGTVIADSDITDFSSLESHQYRKEVIDAVSSGAAFSTRYSSSLKTNMLYYAIFRNNMIIRLAKPLYEVDRSISSLRQLIFNVTVFALIASVIMIIIISLKITKPIRETLSFASDFAKGDYKRRIMNYNNDEIGLLQKSLNTMADTIVETLEAHILEQKKLEATLDSISDGIAMVDSKKNIVIHNNSFLSMLGISGALKDKQYFELIRNSTLNSSIEKNLKTGEKEIFVVDMSNEQFFEAVISPIKRQTTIQGILIVLHDISEKRKIEKMKSDLVSNVSHELKTPIAIIRGYLETVKENYSNRAMTMDYIDRAIENVDRQNALIQDIIKLSMIESVREFEREEIDIKTIIERCLDLLTPKIIKREITLLNSLDNSIDYTVTANHFLVEEIFFNIIDNGINYNRDRGTLSVTASESGGTLTIQISDTGVGIPAEFKERIFERFYRVDRSRSRATGGTGLGLSIVKHAAMVLSWDVFVESDSNGSAFIVTINRPGDHNDISV
ncbi:MAG TPA: ATP-binding protein [Spirochaetota bacterium]|nr:ATP-binding protein [Spirochaetota bacterium]